MRGRLLRVVVAVSVCLMALMPTNVAYAALVIADSFSSTQEPTGYCINADYPALSQTFTAIDGTLDSATLSLQCLGTFPGTVWAEVYAVTGTFGTSASPSGAPLAVSAPLTLPNTGGEYTSFTFAFDNTVTLIGGEHYALVLNSTGAVAEPGPSWNMQWDSPFAGNSARYSASGGYWNTSDPGNPDFVFTVYETTGPTPPPAPGPVEPDAYELDDAPDMAGVLPVDVASAQDRTLHEYDYDWVRVDLQAGTPYEFTAISRPGLGTASVSMTLWPQFVDGGSTYPLASASTFQGSVNTRLMYTPQVSGTYYLEIAPLEWGSTCAYWLVGHVADMWSPDQYEAQDTYGAFVDCGGAPLERALEGPEDVDWFMVNAFEPGEYCISTGFSSQGVPPDTLIEVWDETGTTLLASNDDAADGGPLSSVGQLVVSTAGPTLWRVKVVAAKGPEVWGPYTFSAAPTAPTMGRIFGTVTGPDGAPAPGARVDLVDPYSVVLATTYAASDGSFEFTNWPFGEPFRVRADIEGSGLWPAESPESRDLANPWECWLDLGPDHPDAGFSLQVRRPWITGHVVGTDGYAPLEGKNVTLYDLDGGLLGTTTTNVYGNYFIELPPFTSGRFKVRISDPSGVYRTTWGWDSPDEASSGSFSIPSINTGVTTYMPLSPPPTRFEQTSPEITYGGLWTAATGAGFSGSSLLYGGAGCGSTVAFQGTGIDLVALTGPTYGIARVTLDSGEATLVDLYSPTYAYRQVVYSRRGLAEGAHSVRIEYTGTRNTSSTASRINIDAVDVVGSLTAAPAYPVRFEQGSVEIAYGGVWGTAAGTGFSGSNLSYGGAGCESTVAFQGTGIDLVTLTGPTYGIARVTLDSGEATLVDLYSPTYAYKQVVYSRRGLADGAHSARIEYTGTRNTASTASRINIDAVDVVGSLTAAPAYPTRFEQGSTEIVYAGAWTTATGAGFSGSSLSYGGAACSSTVAFQGTGIDLVTLTGPTYGIARVTLDSGEATLVDLYSPTYAYKQVVYSRRGLAEGAHSVRIEYTGTRNAASTASRINIDAVDVAGSLTTAQ